MFYSDSYSISDKYIERNPGEAMRLIKNRMETIRVKPSDLAVLIGRNRSFVSRFLNDKMVIKPKDCRVVGRALGGVFEVNKHEDGSSVLSFAFGSDDFAVLLRRMREQNSLTERSIIATYEAPVGLLVKLGIEAKDFIITANEEEDSQPTYGNHWVGFRIFYQSRYTEDIMFGILISPRADEVGVGIWTTEPVDHGIMADYRDVVRSGEYEEGEFRSFIERNGRWMPSELMDTAITFHRVNMLNEENDLYPVIYGTFGEYNELMEEFAGTKIFYGPLLSTELRSIAPPKWHDFGMEETSISEESAKQALEGRERVCDIDPEHELYEGEDGDPYVEVARLIPFNSETVEEYGSKLDSPANTIVLCPMCASKLLHASWKIKEDMLMALYDKKISDLKDAGLDVSRLEVLSARQKASDDEVLYRAFREGLRDGRRVGKMVLGGKVNEG